MKRTTGRLVALLTAAAMILTLLPVSALAEETGAEETGFVDTGTQKISCTVALDCAAEEHEEGCPLYQTGTSACDRSDSCKADEHEEGCPLYQTGTSACDRSDSCKADEHEEGCPLRETLNQPGYTSDEVAEMIGALPTAEKLLKYDPDVGLTPEDEDYFTEREAAMLEYFESVQEELKAAREAYDSLSKDAKAEIDGGLKSRLAELEEVFETMGQVMLLNSPMDSGAEILGGATYDTLAEAVAAAKSGDTVRLLKSYESADRIEVEGKTLTIDFGENTYTFTDGDQDALLVTKGAKVTLKGTTGGIAAINGSLNTTGISGETKETGTTLTIAGGHYTAATFGWFVLCGATLNVEGGKTESMYSTGGNGKAGFGDTTINISGGELTIIGNATGADASPAIYHPQSGTLTITGGTITGHSGIELKSGTLDISGDAKIVAVNAFTDLGENNNGSSVEGAAVSIISNSQYAGDPAVTISGGTFAGRGTDGRAFYQATHTGSELPKISITDGQFDGAIDAKIATAFLSGGSYDAKPGSSLLAAGHEAILEGDRYLVTLAASGAAAAIGSKNYPTLADAVTAVKAGETVKLLKSVTGSVTVAADKSFTLDLGPHTLALGSSSLTNQGTLTIAGSGTITSTNHTIVNQGTLTIAGGIIDATAHGTAALKNEVNGVVTITGGELTRSGEKSQSPGNSGGNSWYVVYNQGTIEEISGGYIHANGYYSSLICNVGTSGKRAVIKTISGGKFEQNFVVLKNDDYSAIGEISGGSFKAGAGASQTAVLLNYGSIDEISGGEFVNEGEWAVVLCSNYTSPENAPIVGTIGKITGGTFRAQGNGTALGLKDSTKPISAKPSAVVLNGRFAGKLEVLDGSSLTVSGGYFTADPSDYLADGKAAKAEETTLDGVTYRYTVGNKAGEDVVVEDQVEAGLPDVAEPTLPGLTTQQIEDVKAAAKGVSSEGLEEAAKNLVAVDDTVKAEALDELKKANIPVLEGDTPTVVVVPYFAIEIVDYLPGENTLVLNITPMYILKATTDPDKMIEDKTDPAYNTVPVGTPKAMPVTTPVTISIPLPTGFAGENLFVRHEKAGGAVYHYAVSVQNGVGRFVNPNGFSSFTLLADARKGTISFGEGIGDKAYDLTKVGEKLPAASKSGYTFNGWKINDAVYTELTDALLTLLDSAENRTLTAAAQFTRQGGGSGGGGGGGGGSDTPSAATTNYEFWVKVKKQVEAAKAGDLIEVDAKGCDMMPVTVMDALAQKSVTLVVSWSGGEEITIPAGKTQPRENNRIYWPLSKLAELYKGVEYVPAQPQGTPATPALNPATGGGYVRLSTGEQLAVTGAVSALAAPAETAALSGVTPADRGFEEDVIAATQQPARGRRLPLAAGAVLVAVLAAGSITLLRRRRSAR